MDERPKASLKIDTEGYDEVENMKFEMNLLNQKENQNKGMPSSTRNDNNNKKNQPGENEETGKKSNRSDGQNQTTKVDSSSKNKEIGFESTKDLRREDKTKRTVFHRAALEQNANLLRALCEKIKTENRVEYIEKEDIFANTPLICACMQNIEGQERNRLDCIKILLEFSANARAQNRRTRWSALNWCAYHGDDACISKLLDSNAEPYLPDYDGLFPIDIAGQMKKKEVVLLLFQKLLELFEEYEDYKIKHPEKVNSKYVDDKNIYLQSIQLRTSCLYWGIKYNAPHKKLNRFLQLNNVIPEMPMHQDYMRNCFHASCEENEIDILKTLYHFRDDKKKIDIPNKIFEIKENEMNKQFYSKKFLGHWKKLGSWLTDFQKTLNEGQDVRAFEDQDFYGNSPLHIASFKGYDNCAEFLLDKEANVFLENKEGWRCIELRQHQSIRALYEDYKKQMKRNRKKVKRRETQITQVLPSIRSIGTLTNALDAAQENFFEQRIIPDVVIYFRIPDHDPAKIQSVNFTIKVLSESFQSYLFMGVDKKKYILMIKMDETRLSNECMKLGLKMKLLNSYDYEIYDETRKTDFEPFRSRQRQEITLSAIKKIIDVDQLIDSNIINKIFLMHTVSGAYKIQEIWLSLKKLQPLYEFMDYLTEGKHLNFKALTTLRQYFGEKTAFFFAWSSFCVIYFLPLAIPGMIVAAIAYQTDFSGQILELLIPLWVIYNVLATTLVTERWKRKESEIATRWGVLDLLNNTNVEKQLRKEFVGDEIISEVTGSITKKAEKSRTVIIFILSIPIFFLLLAGVVVVFIYTNNNQDISKFVAGIINGIVITVLNYIYANLARYFVGEENHKYQSSFERSLILKTFIFKFLNSFLGVFYIAFYKQETTLSSLSDTLLSLMITRMASSYLTANVIPIATFWWKKRGYFELVHKEALHSDLNRSTNSAEHNEGKTEVVNLKRAVLDCTLGKNSELNWELAQVELESLKNSEKDLIDHYGDMLVQIGYFTMFAAAFPIGPLIAIVLNLVLVRGKLKAFLTALKRPIAQKSGGLGDWLIVWEIMSVISIYTNAALLYFRTEITLDKNNGDSRLWVYVIAVHLVLIAKYLVVSFIADKPKWVVTEEEKQEFLQEKAIDAMKDREAKLLREHQQNIEKFLKKDPVASTNRSTISDNKGTAETPKNEKPAKDYNQIIPMSPTNGPGKIISTNETGSLKFVLWNTYNLIERKLLIIRMSEIALHTHNLLIKCYLCRQELAVVECVTCSEEFCKKCLVGVHNKVNISSHKIISLTQGKNKGKDGHHDLKKSVVAEPELKKSETMITTSMWRKFENFAFPTQRMNDFQNGLKSPFDILRKVYINDNWISDDNTIIDLNVLKKANLLKTIKDKDLDLIGQKRGDQTQSFQKFIDISELNLEEKFILNKIAFLNFKKRGAKVKFHELFKQLKIFQEGSLESKLFLLFDILDEDEDGFISINDCLSFLQPRFFQNMRYENEIESVLIPLFEGMARLEKKDFFKVFLDQPAAKEIMSVALQV